MGRIRAEVKVVQVANKTPDKLGKLTQALWSLINEFYSMYKSEFYDLNNFYLRSKTVRRQTITTIVEMLDYLFCGLFLW